MSAIKIGDVKVPLLDYAVSCTAILGIRDSGKTISAKGIAEQLLDNGIPIVVFDAVGKWRWLKVPGTHRGGKGYKVVVAGGRQPDIALNPQSVGEIVRAAVKERIPLVIDLYDPNLSKADWRRIVQESIRIIHYDANGVAHVFLEEAAEYCPQRVVDGATYAEVEKLARMGGNASVGLTLINQRSQEVNKAVLDLAHNLILGCQIGNKAIEAVERWVDRLSPDTARKITASLPKLESGQAWVWTRSNPDDPKLERMPMCRSLHPDRRTRNPELAAVSSIDTSEFITKMNDAMPKLVAETKANDPTELKREIARLKRELGSVPVAAPTIKEVPMLQPEERALLNDAALDMEIEWDKVDKSFRLLEDLFKNVLTIKDAVAGRAARSVDLKMINGTWKQDMTSKPRVERTAAAPAASSNGLPDGERKILEALIQFPDGLAREQLTVLTGYKRSTRDAYIQRLKSRDYVQLSGTSVSATDAGCAALPNSKPLPTGSALREIWFDRLPLGESAIFDVIVKSYPDAISREEISNITQFKRSTRDAYLQRMKSKMLWTEPQRGLVRANDNLFL